MNTYSALHPVDSASSSKPSLTCETSASDTSDSPAPQAQHQVPPIDLAYLHTEDSPPVNPYIASPLYHPKPSLLSRIYYSILGKKPHPMTGALHRGNSICICASYITLQMTGRSARSTAGAPVFASTEDCYDD